MLAKKIISLMMAGVFSLFLMGGCATSSASDSSSDETAASSAPWVDYAKNGTVQLKLDYLGHDFYKDGVGQMTLRTPIDGDTAHFDPVITTTSDEAVKARFYGIDTPESTGKVQEWGKDASNYTKEQLKEADKNGTIVVSSPSDSYGTPSYDSTGTRFISLVWISLDTKNAPLDKLYLLNLMIVENGYSYVKNVSDLPEYADTFYAAEDQAKAYKLNLFSGEPDPLFNYGDYEDVTLLEIKEEVEKEIADPTYTNKYDNVKVRVQGTVAGFANNIIYLESFFSEENGARVPEGEYAGVNIFVGMSSIPSKYYTRNAYIQVCGLAEDSDTFGFQITSASFPIISSSEDDAQVLIKPADNTDEFELHTFEYDPDKLVNSDLTALFCLVHLNKPIKVTGGYKSTDGSELTLYTSYSGQSLPFSIYIGFSYKGDPLNQNYIFSNVSDYVGKQFDVTGIYTYYRSSTTGKNNFQITPCTSADLVLEA